MGSPALAADVGVPHQGVSLGVARAADQERGRGGVHEHPGRGHAEEERGGAEGGALGAGQEGEGREGEPIRGSIGGPRGGPIEGPRAEGPRADI